MRLHYLLGVVLATSTQLTLAADWVVGEQRCQYAMTAGDHIGSEEYKSTPEELIADDNYTTGGACSTTRFNRLEGLFDSVVSDGVLTKNGVIIGRFIIEPYNSTAGFYYNNCPPAS